MPENGGGAPKLNKLRDISGNVNIIQSLFFPGNSA